MIDEALFTEAEEGANLPGRIGQTINLLARRTDTVDNQVVGLFKRPATPEEVTRFFVWYKKTYQSAAAPLDPIKFREHFMKWAGIELRKQQTSARQEAARQAAPVRTPPAPLTQAEQEEMHRSADQVRHNLQAGGAAQRSSFFSR